MMVNDIVDSVYCRCGEIVDNGCSRMMVNDIVDSLYCRCGEIVDNVLV